MLHTWFIKALIITALFIALAYAFLQWLSTSTWAYRWTLHRLRFFYQQAPHNKTNRLRLMIVDIRLLHDDITTTFINLSAKLSPEEFHRLNDLIDPWANASVQLSLHRVPSDDTLVSRLRAQGQVISNTLKNIAVFYQS